MLGSSSGFSLRMRHYDAGGQHTWYLVTTMTEWGPTSLTALDVVAVLGDSLTPPLPLVLITGLLVAHLGNFRWF